MDRREFIGKTILGMTVALPGWRLESAIRRKLAFSTLACPDWPWPVIIDKAKSYGYDGIEIRGVQSELIMPRSPFFAGEAWRESKQRASDAAIEIINLNSSAHLHETNPAGIRIQMDMIKRDMELAEKLDCPFVRVFPDRFPKELSKAQALDLFVTRLSELAEFGNGMKTKVLLDAHGDLVYSTDLSYVLSKMDGKTGLIWDYFNMFSETGEELDVMFENIRSSISLVQLKDGSVDQNGVHKYVLLGGGFLPKEKILTKLDEIDYRGYISFEWEKRWHPQLLPPEIALPDFIQKMRSQDSSSV